MILMFVVVIFTAYWFHLFHFKMNSEVSQSFTSSQCFSSGVAGFKTDGWNNILSWTGHFSSTRPIGDSKGSTRLQQARPFLLRPCFENQFDDNLNTAATIECLSHGRHSWNHIKRNSVYRTGKSNETNYPTHSWKRCDNICARRAWRQAALWRLRCPVRRLVPSEWARSVSGFWTHSSFKCGAT